MANKMKDFKGDPGGLIGDAMWSAVKPLYKEAKKRGDSIRAKEYGRKSIDDPRATVDRPAGKGTSAKRR